MKDWIKRALTKTINQKSVRRRDQILVVEPSDRLVLGVKFAIAMTLCLTTLEIAHMAFLGGWSSEIFAALTSLIGTIMGILISHKT
ncbi:hypothetical protein HXY32_01635 [Candidatus Bathyarchaeota archaeon]|nr:hypothetical protein [Candidatus Bathyarchaeota archaeon]